MTNEELDALSEKETEEMISQILPNYDSQNTSDLEQAFSYNIRCALLRHKIHIRDLEASVKGVQQGGRNIQNAMLEKLAEKDSILMNSLYSRYKKASKKLDDLYEYWEREKVEDYFREPKWYNAHARRKRYMKELETCHRQMFHILVAFDGNGHEEFSPMNSIDAHEIMDDFNGKYLNSGISA